MMQQWPLPKRTEFISQLISSSQPIGQYQLEFQGSLEFRNVYRVDIGLPCYRLENGRTKSAQIEIVVSRNLTADFFEADPDSQPALEIQHQILEGMVTTGTEAQITEILRSGKQTQPLILDQQGYLVNGNRRLCAMRLLLEEDKEEFNRYKHVQVVILPPHVPDDIYELEARLQWQPDGRSEYSWIDKALILRVHRHRGLSFERLSSFYGMSQKEMQPLISMLEDAESYLEERGCSGKYSKVLKKYHAFEKLYKGRRKCDGDEPKKQLFTAVSHLMMDDPDAAGRRLYESIPDALKFLDDVTDQIKDDLSSELEVISAETEDDNLELLGNSGNSPYQAVCELLRNPEHFEKAREVVRDKIEEMRAADRERYDASYCAREVRKACTALQNARANLNDSSTTEGILELIVNILEVCEELRASLSEQSS